MAHASLAYSGGFADPVYQSQSAFKTLMDCMARPGLIGTLQTNAAPPSPLCAGAGAIALTLCDHDTPVYLSTALIEAGIPGWLAFQAGVLVTDDRTEAAFAFIDAASTLPPLSTFAAGTQEYPDRSATIVLEISGLTGGPERQLTGPGIDGSTRISPADLPPHFDDMWRENSALYPRGCDLILVCGQDIICLPRSIKISTMEV
jgi:alpha-D-ribose 1-methylphosphonate 5-triphosphate synthase subunit PhnH